MAESLRGQLLIAAPSLYDYFRRSVVLVLEHSEEGAIGVVLNRESETRVVEAIPALASLAEPEELVRIGGPVSPQSVVALGDFEDVAEAGTHVVGSLGTLDPEAENESLRRVRVYAGYAGWAKTPAAALEWWTTARTRMCGRMYSWPRASEASS